MIAVHYIKGSLQYLAWPPWVALHSHPYQVSDLGHGHAILLSPEVKSLMLPLCHGYVGGGKGKPVSLALRSQHAPHFQRRACRVKPAKDRKTLAAQPTIPKRVKRHRCTPVNCLSCEFGSGGRAAIHNCASSSSCVKSNVEC